MLDGFSPFRILRKSSGHTGKVFRDQLFEALVELPPYLACFFPKRASSAAFEVQLSEVYLAVVLKTPPILPTPGCAQNALQFQSVAVATSTVQNVIRRSTGDRQTARSPRRTSARSQEAQFLTRYFVL